MFCMKHETMNLFDDEKILRRYVESCDCRLDEKIEKAIECIEKTPDLRIFGLTGPTCSGKTTAAKKITKHLEEKGRRVHVISIDDFYFDKEYLQKRADNDPSIEIDYDSEDTIDIDLLAEQTDHLLSGEKTYLPHFDFQSGKRTVGEYLVPNQNDVFLFEGIQILYPRVNAILNHSPSYRSIYICPLSALCVGEEIFEPNEIRLMRRLVRDFRHRASSPEFTLYLWKSVRENEERSIFPYVQSCDATIDSTLSYEIGMLTPYLKPLLDSIGRKSEFYSEAQRILARIKDIQEVDASYMTPNSLYKEFI